MGEFERVPCPHGELVDIRDGEICYWQCGKCVKDAKDKKTADAAEAAKVATFRSMITDGGLWNGPIEFPRVPRRFEGKTIEDFQDRHSQEKTKIKSLVKMYVKNFSKAMENGTSMILAGKPGTGKTHLAWGIVNELRKKMYTAALIMANSMTNAVKSTYSKDSGHRADEVIKAFSSMDLLIIDEVGVQVQTDSDSQQPYFEGNWGIYR
jgi:DNA replication protein DnaC